MIPLLFLVLASADLDALDRREVDLRLGGLRAFAQPMLHARGVELVDLGIGSPDLRNLFDPIVADVNRALRFYVDTLGFEKRWHEGNGAGGVCQVNRGECEIILCEDRTRTDKSRLFIELNRDGLDELRRVEAGDYLVTMTVNGERFRQRLSSV